MYEDKRAELAEAEYQKLVADGKIDQRLLQHPSFYEAFYKIFFHYVGNNSYTVNVNGNSVEVRSECNYPEETNGVYKGYKNATKHSLMLEKDGKNEYLIAKDDSAAIFVYPQERQDGVSASFGVTAYDEDGKEHGYSNCHYVRNGRKYEDPLMYINSNLFNPNLSSRMATRSYGIHLPRNLDILNWEAENCVRYTPGVVKKIYTGVGKEDQLAFGNIGLEHPNRLAGNNDDFVIGGKKRNGEVCSEEELKAFIDECAYYYNMNTGRSR